MPTDLLSESDAAVLKKVVGQFGTVGDLFQLGVAANEWRTDTQDEHRNEQLFGSVGNVAGGIGGTAFALATASAFSNPLTALLAGGVLIYLSSEVGESVGGAVGSTFDTPKP